MTSMDTALDTTADTVATPWAGPARPRHRRRRSVRLRPLLAAVALTWVAMFVTAPLLDPGPTVHRLALFAHLAALVLGFGAVLTVDWFGLMWLLGRHSLAAVIHVAHGAHAPIWLGLAGLTASGMVLSPDTSSPLVVAKLVAVLAVAVNGLYARQVQQLMSAMPGPVPPRPLLLRGALVVTISQAGWWTATVVGFLNAQQ